METGLFKRREPMGFMLGLGLLSIGLTFFCLLLAMLSLSSGKGISWTTGKMPTVFWFSTLLIVGSSFTLEQAGKFAKNDQFSYYRLALWATLALTVGFILAQMWGWSLLQSQKIYLRGGFLGAFLYVLSGLHILHVLGGVFFLVWRIVIAHQKSSYLESYIFHVNPPNQLKWRFLARYWHFIGGIWVVFFLFLLFKGFTTF
ncbi:MAG: heme-copper oxidase subunit III [Bacteroidetes bacterium]|nr:MAG: heme-copper oxidase subunit III [Bacteroidota bacterium]